MGTLTVLDCSSKWDKTDSPRFLMWAGYPTGASYFLIFADHLQDAFDELIDWCDEHAPGILCDEQVNEAYIEAIAEGKTEEEAYEIAEVDTTCRGNAGQHIASDGWGIVAENPSRKTLLEFLGREPWSKHGTNEIDRY